MPYKGFTFEWTLFSCFLQQKLLRAPTVFPLKGFCFKEGIQGAFSFHYHQALHRGRNNKITFVIQFYGLLIDTYFSLKKMVRLPARTNQLVVFTPATCLDFFKGSQIYCRCLGTVTPWTLLSSGNKCPGPLWCALALCPFSPATAHEP